jgi:CBS domain-containing protein
MDTVGQLLDAKLRDGDSLEVWTIQPYASVYDAIEAMAQRDVGALVVTDGDKPVGIVSERDYARKGILHRRFALDTIVADIMSNPVVCVSPEEHLGNCMQRMVNDGIRYLPVVADSKLIGMVTIGDLLRAALDRDPADTGFARRIAAP